MAPSPFHPAEPSLFRSTMTVASTSSIVSSSIREQATQRAVASSSQMMMGQPEPPVINPFQHAASNAYSDGGDGSRGRDGNLTHSPPPTSIVVGTPTPSSQWNTPMMMTGQQSTAPARHDSDFSARPHEPSPSSAPPPAPVSSAAITAADARREWQVHGTGRTQVLQDQANRATFHGQLMARVVSHAPRVDVAGSKYTAYVLSVTGPAHPSGSSHNTPGTAAAAGGGSVSSSWSWQMERRYSEFNKLHSLLQRSCSPAVATHLSRFPSKHWSSAKLLRGWSATTDISRQNIEDRAVQLDVWLVQVLTEYNRGSLDDGSRRAVYDFLCTLVPPCDRDTGATDATGILSGAGDLPGYPQQDGSGGRDYDYPPPPQRQPLHGSAAKVGPEERIKYHNPWTTTLGSSLRQAVHTIEQLTTSHVDSSIPLDLLQSAHGLLFLTVVKGGMVFSGRVGTGILVAKRDDDSNSSYFDSLHRRVGSPPAPPAPPAGGQWSAPCAISVWGVGWGALVGGDVTHYLVVLTSLKATMDLVSSTRLQLGAELGVAVGPVGRGANSHLQTGDWTVHPAYAYAISHGLFVGMSLEGSVLRVRDDVNAVFYGRPISATQILHHPPVKAAEPLYRAIGRAMQAEIPPGAFRPSEYFSSKGHSSSRGVNQASSYGDSHYLYNSVVQPQHVPYQNQAGPSQSHPSQGYATPSPSWASASQGPTSWGT